MSIVSVVNLKLYSRYYVNYYLGYKCYINIFKYVNVYFFKNVYKCLVVKKYFL